jgi:hypothetical protein
VVRASYDGLDLPPDIVEVSNEGRCPLPMIDMEYLNICNHFIMVVEEEKLFLHWHVGIVLCISHSIGSLILLEK